MDQVPSTDVHAVGNTNRRADSLTFDSLHAPLTEQVPAHVAVDDRVRLGQPGHAPQRVSARHVPTTGRSNRLDELLDVSVESLVLRLALEGERGHVIQVPTNSPRRQGVVSAQIAGVFDHDPPLGDVEDLVLALRGRGDHSPPARLGRGVAQCTGVALDRFVASACRELRNELSQRVPPRWIEVITRRLPLFLASLASIALMAFRPSRRHPSRRLRLRPCGPSERPPGPRAFRPRCRSDLPLAMDTTHRLREWEGRRG